MTLDTNTPELRFAIGAVNKANQLVKLVQAEMVSPALTKHDKSPVTVADFAAQALVANLMHAALPDVPLVAEEESAVLQASGQAGMLDYVSEYVSRFLPTATPESVSEWIDYGNATPDNHFWTLDPVDGTKGFLRGGQYVVALAMIVAGEVQIGVIGCPNMSQGYIQDPDGPGSIVVAVKNEGTWLVSAQDDFTAQQLQVSDVTDPAHARLLRSFEASHTSVSHLDQIVSTLNTDAEPVLLDSQAKYSILAAGHGDLLFRLISPSSPNYEEKIWDQAAGSLVVQEAGGMVTDLDGKPLDFSQGRTLKNNRGVLASNGHLHTVALDAIKVAKA